MREVKMKDVFYISGKKELIFRKEGSVYVSFDPLSLTFLRLNFTASEILFKISENTNYESIIEHFCKKYKITEERISKDIDIQLLRGLDFIAAATAAITARVA